MADPIELELVAMNLIKNALEAVEGLPAGMVNIAVSEHNGKAELTVLNNGPAVSSELVERLNDRAASGSSSKKSGLGLGLSIVRSILERLGGRITFTAWPGADWLPWQRFPRSRGRSRFIRRPKARPMLQSRETSAIHQ